MIDYRKPLKQENEKWWLHQYCLYKGISLSKVKVKDKLQLDKNLNAELDHLQSLVKPTKKHKQRIKEIESILREHRQNIVDSAPQYDWNDYDWDKHIVYESSKNSREITKQYQIDNNVMELTFNEHDINMIKEYNIDGQLIRAYEIEQFRSDMKACAVAFGLIQGIDHNQVDKDGRVVKLLRIFCDGYMNYFTDIHNNILTLDHNNRKVSMNKISYDIDKWISYCRRLDIAIDHYTKDSKWKNNKESLLTDIRQEASTNEYAKIFVVFYTKYESINQKSQAKIDKLLELNLPNINENIAKQIVKYSTLANVKSK